MSSSNWITTSTGDYSDSIEHIAQLIEDSDSVLVGAGAGMSTAAGFTYDGERFDENFADFRDKYGVHDMYSAGFLPFECPEESWAYWSRSIFLNRYDCPVGKPYSDLLAILDGRDYFVLTTNVDHQFQRAGFDKDRLFYTQGDYGLWQCSDACHPKTYDNEDVVRQMVERQSLMRVPSELVPFCPVCGKPMTTNLRVDEKFVQDEGWYAANDRFAEFVDRGSGSKRFLLELGVGTNTPGIIKYPFWQMTIKNPEYAYACINLGEVICPADIRNRCILLDADIAESVADLKRIVCK